MMMMMMMIMMILEYDGDDAMMVLLMVTLTMTIAIASLMYIASACTYEHVWLPLSLRGCSQAVRTNVDAVVANVRRKKSGGAAR